MEPSEEIREVAIRWVGAMREGDIDGLDLRLSRMKGFLMLGTDAREVWTDGAEAAEIVRIQMQETGGAFPIIEIHDVHGYREASIGWADGTFSWETPSGPLNCRFTSVLHLEHGEWRMVQWHASVGFSNQQLVGFEATTHLEEVAEAVREERPDLSAETSPEGTVVKGSGDGYMLAFSSARKAGVFDRDPTGDRRDVRRPGLPDQGPDRGAHRGGARPR